MPDNLQHDDADELDALPPEFMALHHRLSDDSAAWQRKLPPAEALERFARATPQQRTAAAHRSDIRHNIKGTVSMYETTPTSQPIKKPYRAFIPAFVAVVVVALLAVVFVQSHGGRSAQPGAHLTATATTVASTGCASHITVPAQVNLGAIAMTSPDDGWALGSKGGSDNLGVGVLLHYTHCQWQVTDQAYPDLNLTSLVMLSATDGWVTGGSDDGKQQLVLHDVGGTWQRVTIPDGLATGGIPYTLVMAAADEGWLQVLYPKDVHGLSHYGLLHYQQGTWTGVNAPIAYIADLSAAAPDDVWLVGSHQYNDGSTILAHYANGAWSQQQGPAHLDMAHIHMTAPTDGVVVFSLYGKDNSSQPENNVAWRYNGATWAPLDLGGDRTGQDVHLFSSTQGWAFSKAYASTTTSVIAPISGAAHEVNGQWQTTTWPITYVDSINGISRVSDSDYWATGTKRDTSNHSVTSVFLHYSNGTWSEVGQ